MDKEEKTIRPGRLPARNIAGHPGRTAVLIILTALLALVLCGGSMFLKSLRNGFATLENRLGADVIVVPKDAEEKLEKVVLEGVPSYFYMKKEVLTEVKNVSGVEKASPQYFLCSAKAGCCSMPVQIIGFDPETDFSVAPWIMEATGKDLGLFDIVAGANINAQAGGDVTFYGNVCHVVSKLAPTGSQLDNAVYATNETILALTRSSVEKGINYLAQNSPEGQISAVQVKVAEGEDPAEIAKAISQKVDGAAAIETSLMLSGLSASLSGISRTIRLTLILIWVLAAVILFVACTLLTRTRVSEFAYLRTIGVSRSMLSGLILKESLLTGLAAGVIGCAVSILILNLFHTAIENAVGLPYLTPSAGYTAVAAMLALVITVLTGSAAAAYAAYRASGTQTGNLLRKGN